MTTTSGESPDEPVLPAGRPPEPTAELPIDPTITTPVYWGPAAFQGVSGVPSAPSSFAAPSAYSDTSAPSAFSAPSAPPPPPPTGPYPPLPTYPGSDPSGPWGSPPGPPGSGIPPSYPPPPGSGRGSQAHPGYGRVIAAAVALALVAASLGASLGVTLAHHQNSSSPSNASSILPGSGGQATNPANPSNPNSPFFPTNPGTSPSPSNPGSGSSLDAAAIAAKVDPAVVDINTTLAYQNGSAAGTGMIISPSGEVLTNNHVIEGASKITVQIAGKGPSYPAQIIGFDKSDDVALLQMEGVSGVKTVELSDSSRVAVGDPVVAIGNALNLPGPPSVAQGSVTAVNQAIQVGGSDGTTENLSGLIQTNAQLQQGDSGGPLVNASAQVIGMDTAASVGRRFTSGSATGFAIPIKTAKSIADQMKSGQANANIHIGPSAFLGVELRAPGTSGGSGSSSGAVLSGVAPSTPAEAAGLASGDTIVTFDGKTINSSSDLTELLSGHHPGDRVQVGWVDPSGQHHSATVRLASGPPA
jgi:S1-C subfamily serine protease